MKPTGIFDQVRFLQSRVDRLEAVLLAQDATIRRLSADLGAKEPIPDGAEPQRRNMIEIAGMVAADNGLTLAEMRGDNRAFEFAHPRQFAMMLMVDAGHTTGAVGRFFGRDHTTVMHGVQAARKRAERNG